jgi:hypothetical protein
MLLRGFYICEELTKSLDHLTFMPRIHTYSVSLANYWEYTGNNFGLVCLAPTSEMAATISNGMEIYAAHASVI